MDGRQFDNLTRFLASRISRRGVFAALQAGLVASRNSPAVSAQPNCREAGHPCEGNQACCGNLVCRETSQGSSQRCTSTETREQDAIAAPAATADVSTTLAYRIDVSCDYDPESDQTSCLFVGTAEGDVPPVVAVVLPIDSVCDDVVEGECEIVEWSDGGGEAYRSERLDQQGRPRCMLVFAGRVAVASSSSYWCETGQGTFPAEGDGLSCPRETPTGELSDSSGAILVHASQCPGAGTGGDYDWYASCLPDPQPSEFQLQPVGDSDTGESLTASSIGEEPARFLLLEPGAYALTEVDGNWCHAESDNTNDAGEVLVEAGRSTNVWVFHCPTGTS